MQKDALNYSLFAFYFLAVIAVFSVRDHAFFWDTIQLGSKHAHWYFDHRFQHFFLPAEIDSGHPPIFGMYLAIVWTIFGKSLAVSHFAMLPFILVSIYCFYRIGELLAPGQSIYLLLLLYADPVLATQSLLISPDVVLVCFFSLGLWGILARHSLLKCIGIIGLGLVSLRGMMAGLALYCFQIFHTGALSPKAMIRALPPYLPGGLLALSFLIAHHVATGWIGYHADSPWAPSLEKVGFTGFVRNIGILVWRFLDFGRVFIWPALLILWFRRGKEVSNDRSWSLSFQLTLATILLLVPSVLLHRHLSAHRYLLPIFISINFLFYQLLFCGNRRLSPYRKLLYGLVVTGLLSGNLWIYPKNIAQGWDATMAHLPYYQLRIRMLDYLNENGIPLQSVGTAFPEIGSQQQKDLQSSDAGMVEKDLSSQSYIFYSNVMNDFNDAELQELEQNWEEETSFQKNRIFVILYRRK